MGFFDTLLGRDASEAANRAAADTYAKQQAASGAIRSYGDTLPGAYSEIAKLFTPYASAGSGALQMLMNGAGLNGDAGSQAYANAYRNSPGYQYGLDAGGQAVAGNANAGNMLQSGKTLRALQQFGSDYESTKSGDFWNRLMGLQGQGLQATGAQASTMGQGLQGQLATRQSAYQGDMGSAGTIGQGMVAGANAENQALTNLMKMGTYLGGAALGGPIGASFGKSLFGGGSSWPSSGTTAYRPSPWG